jgi:cell division protein FtsB
MSSKKASLFSSPAHAPLGGMSSTVKLSRSSSCSRLLAILACAVLLTTCVSLSLLVRGAKHANHELQLELEAQRNQMDRLKQSIAEEKVVIVDSEEKSKRLGLEVETCQQELAFMTGDAQKLEAGLRTKIESLEKDLIGCSTKISDAVDRIDQLISDAGSVATR